MPNTPHGPLARRSVLRVGATAAWAAPAIVLATEVPGFAASTPAPTATVTITDLTRSGATLHLSTMLRNNTSETLSAPLAEFDFSRTATNQPPGPPQQPLTFAPYTVTQPPVGWVLSQSGTGFLVYQRGPLAPGEVALFELTMEVSNPSAGVGAVYLLKDFSTVTLGEAQQTFA